MEIKHIYINTSKLINIWLKSDRFGMEINLLKEIYKAVKPS